MSFSNSLMQFIVFVYLFLILVTVILLVISIIKRKKRLLIASPVILIFIVSIPVILVVQLFGRPAMTFDEWKQFKRETVIKHDFIKDVNISTITPPPTSISYQIKKTSSYDEIESAFSDLQIFLSDKKTLNKLKEAHHKSIGSYPSNIHVRFYSDEKLLCEFYSISDIDENNIKWPENYKGESKSNKLIIDLINY